MTTQKSVCGGGGTVAIYFASNGIFYPDTISCFHDVIVSQNTFEWFKTRYQLADKHIFLRDIKKSWYIMGVNQHINSVEKLLNYLRKECENKNIVTIGSSAGGYAALLFGVLLNAEAIFSFAGQFSLQDELDEASKSLYSHFFLKKALECVPNKRFVDITDILNEKCNSDIYYFYGINSQQDLNQVTIAKRAHVPINFVPVISENHGVVIDRLSLETVLAMEFSYLHHFLSKIKQPVSSSYIGWYCLPLHKKILNFAKRVLKKIFNKLKKKQR